MEKRILAVAIFTLMAIGFASCSKESSNIFDPSVPEEVRADFQSRFPNAKRVEWGIRGNIIEAEFNMNSTEYDAWFEKSATWQWIRTEINLRNPNKGLPQAILNYISINYPGWRISDADQVKSPKGDYYEIELEKNGEYDVTIFIKDDGTLLYSFTDFDTDNDYIQPTVLPQAVITQFNKLYPKAIRVKWEKDMRLYEAEFIDDYQRCEALFREDGTWVSTKIELRVMGLVLPTAITTYISANYPGYKIDDVNLIKTPSDEYYMIELEKGASPDATLLIRADGTLVTI